MNDLLVTNMVKLHLPNSKRKLNQYLSCVSHHLYLHIVNLWVDVKLQTCQVGMLQIIIIILNIKVKYRETGGYLGQAAYLTSFRRNFPSPVVMNMTLIGKFVW